MTSQTQSGDTTLSQATSAKDVEAYLEKHPEFFQDNPELLTQLTVPHPAGGAVSLIERQVALLRDENKQLRLRIKDLVEIARENEELVNKLHLLSVDLIASQSLENFSSVLTTKLESNFDASHVSIKIFREAIFGDEENADFVSKTDKRMQNFEKFLRHKTPVCGRFNSQQLAFLFGDKALEVKSLALIPLVDKDAIGMFAIGSTDPDHFKAGMSTSLLASLGDVASSVINRLIR